MEKLNIRFDTDRVNAELDVLSRRMRHSKSQIARTAMNFGLRKFKEGVELHGISDLAELIAVIDSAVVTKDDR